MLFFSHIPKTGGTTFTYLLRSHFGPGCLSILKKGGGAYTRDDLENDLKMFPWLKCLSGHLLKPFIDYGNDQNTEEWLTFIRNPVDRYISQYVHQQTSDQEHFKMDIFKWSRTFSRSNWQTKWIAGEENLQKAIDIIEEKNITIGITERFDQSLLFFKSKIKSLEKLDTVYKKKKMVIRDQSMKTELLNDKYKDLLLSENQLDLDLYEYVENALNNHIESLDETNIKRQKAGIRMQRKLNYSLFYIQHVVNKGITHYNMKNMK